MKPLSVIESVERSGLSPAQLEALSSLLEIAERLPHLTASLNSIRRASSDIESGALALAGIAPFERQDGFERVFVSVTLEEHTEKLWSATLELPGEDAVARYYDGPTRNATMANGLVLLASVLLRKAADVGQSHWLAEELDQVMERYEERLCPEPVTGSFHGCGGVD